MLGSHQHCGTARGPHGSLLASATCSEVRGASAKTQSDHHTQGTAASFLHLLLLGFFS